MSKTSSTRRAAAVTVAFSLFSGCVTQSGGEQSAHWEIDAVTQKCISALVVGTALGAVIGAAAGRGRGAAIGAGAGLAAGGATCAVMAALDAQDRERIKAAQLEAARSGNVQELAYSGSDGLQRQIRVAPQPPLPAQSPPMATRSETSLKPVNVPQGKICRAVDTSASVMTKGNTEIPPQRFCRTPAGDWEPVPDVTA